jgi:hypothetical protein
MIITIDTHKDDANSIRRAIALLQSLADGTPIAASGPSENSAAAFAGIFGDDAPAPQPSLGTLAQSSSALAAAVPPKQPEIELY